MKKASGSTAIYWTLDDQTGAIRRCCQLNVFTRQLCYQRGVAPSPGPPKPVDRSGLRPGWRRVSCPHPSGAGCQRQWSAWAIGWCDIGTAGHGPVSRSGCTRHPTPIWGSGSVVRATLSRHQTPQANREISQKHFFVEVSMLNKSQPLQR